MKYITVIDYGKYHNHTGFRENRCEGLTGSMKQCKRMASHQVYDGYFCRTHAALKCLEYGEQNRIISHD